jgi:feruloyl esterase
MLAFGASPAVAKTSCETLAHTALPGTTILSAQFVPAAQETLGDEGGPRSVPVPDLCRVEGRIGAYIRFAVWMPPADKWNGKFAMFGGGGLAGFISYASMAGAAERGYATASTDTGHDRSDYTWLKDPERVRDYADRAIHQTALMAKDVISAFYGEGATKSLFCGCSNGGRQGMIEAQRYPDDFDGIISGAPAFDYSGLLLTQIWYRHAAYPGAPGTPSLLSTAILKIVKDAVIAKCDGSDLVTDGVIEDPTQCKFDPAVVMCSASAADNCLTPVQVAAVREVYSGVPDLKPGKPRIAGFEFGGETGWAFNTENPELHPYVQAIFDSVIYHVAHWDWRSLKFPADVKVVDSTFGTMFNADNPDLRRFQAHGGKLIIYQGWDDNLVPPTRPISYFEDVGRAMKADPRSFFRLFMVPGMGHCAGGAGTDTFDKISMLDDWVTHKLAPERVIASHMEKGAVVRTRPLCVYPKVARWSGHGSTDDAANFMCADDRK